MVAFDEAKLIEDTFYLNECVIVDNNYDAALDWIYNKFPASFTCPFCYKQLAALPYLVDNGCFTYDYDEFNGECGRKAELRACFYCSYWQWYYEDGLDLNSYGCPDHFWHSALSKIKTYNDEIPPECHSEIAVALRRKPDLFHHMAPTELEKFVASVFKANFADCEVFHVGRPDDGGVDVLFIDSNKVEWLIQVKRREHSNASEGVGTIRNLLGTLVLEDCSSGIIISTADHFTYRAYQAVGRANEKGFKVKLIDKGKLLRLIGPLLPLPWLDFVNINYPELNDIFKRKSVLLHEKFNCIKFNVI